MSFHSPPHPGVLRTCLHWIRQHISSQTTASEKMVTELLLDNKNMPEGAVSKVTRFK